jgi:hypothetical protein
MSEVQHHLAKGYKQAGRFQALQELPGEDPIDEQWKSVKKAVTTTCKEVLGLKKHSHKEWTRQKALT